MNHLKTIKTLIFPLALSLFVSACATNSIASRNEQTSDLALFAADAIESAEMVGHDQVLVVFDIDNTLLAMEQGLGADQWYEWQKHLANNDPCHQQAVSDRLAIQGALYFASAMRPTQAEAPALLRSKSFPTILSNPRYAINVYTLSKRAPSATRPPLQKTQSLSANGELGITGYFLYPALRARNALHCFVQNRSRRFCRTLDTLLT